MSEKPQATREPLPSDEMPVSTLAWAAYNSGIVTEAPPFSNPSAASSKEGDGVSFDNGLFEWMAQDAVRRLCVKLLLSGRTIKPDPTHALNDAPMPHSQRPHLRDLPLYTTQNVLWLLSGDSARNYESRRYVSTMTDDGAVEVLDRSSQQRWRYRRDDAAAALAELLPTLAPGVGAVASLYDLPRTVVAHAAWIADGRPANAEPTMNGRELGSSMVSYEPTLQLWVNISPDHHVVKAGEWTHAEVLAFASHQLPNKLRTAIETNGRLKTTEDVPAEIFDWALYYARDDERCAAPKPIDSFIARVVRVDYTSGLAIWNRKTDKLIGSWTREDLKTASARPSRAVELKDVPPDVIEWALYDRDDTAKRAINMIVPERSFGASCEHGVLSLIDITAGVPIGTWTLNEVERFAKEQRMAQDPNPEITLDKLPEDVFVAAAFEAGCSHRRPKTPGWQVYKNPLDPQDGTVVIDRGYPERRTVFTREQIRDRIMTFMSDAEAERLLGIKAPKEQPTMTTETTKAQEILKTLTADATDAAWRTAGSQFVKLVRDPLAALIARHLAPDDESIRAKVATFLQTEIGTAMLAGLLSVALSAAPVRAEISDRLARELRVRGLADAGDLVAEVVMGPLRQVMALYLQDVPGIVATAAAAAAPAIDPPAARPVATPDIKVKVAT